MARAHELLAGVTLSRLFGTRPTRMQLNEMVGSVDLDESGYIEFQEFAKMTSEGTRVNRGSLKVCMCSWNHDLNIQGVGVRPSAGAGASTSRSVPGVLC